MSKMIISPILVYGFCGITIARKRRFSYSISHNAVLSNPLKNDFKIKKKKIKSIVRKPYKPKKIIFQNLLQCDPLYHSL